MDEKILEAIETGDTRALSPEELAILAEQLIPEFKRLRKWVAVCVGRAVSEFGGEEV